MTEDEMNLDMLVAELEQENRLLRARNERLMAEAQASNFERTAAWLKACGKEQMNPAHMSVQIGVHFEEIVELLECIETDCVEDNHSLECIADDMRLIATSLKKATTQAFIKTGREVDALDALCDTEVTGNGIAYLSGFDKNGADKEVLTSNESKLVNGKPVLMPGGKIGKGPNYKAPELEKFV
jgi:hypothetical protein